MGIKALRKIQTGQEATAGTKVDATAIWRGMGVLEDTTETLFIEEDIGYLTGVDRTLVTKYGGALSMDSTPATFEALPIILSASIMADSATADGSGYIHEFNAATTVVADIDTYTIEGGDNEGAEYMAYAFVDNFTLSGDAGGQLEMSADWIGRKITTTTFTATAELPAVESIPFSMGKLYIDTATATIGTTQITGTWLGTSLEVDPGRQEVYTGDGNLYFNFVKQVMPEMTCEFSMEYNATSIAEVAAWRAGTARAIKMIWEGSALTTPGVTYTKKTLIVEMAGKWETFSGLEDADGNDTIVGTFRIRYNADQGFALKITVVNELAAVP